MAAGLGLVALPGFVWPAAIGWMILADVLWVAAFAVDAFLVTRPDAIAVTREAPPAFSVGRSVPVTWRWRNAGRRRARLLVREMLPEPLGGAAGPTRSVMIPGSGGADERLDVRPVRRGRGSGGRLTIRALGPLGLAWRQFSRNLPWTTTVYPALERLSLRALPAEQARRREAGLRNVRRLGEGRIFETLREWVPGDDTRSIDWKATARRGKLMARQYEDERRQQVLLVIDAGRLMTAESAGTSRLEAAVGAALKLAWTVIEHDDDVGLMVFADEVQSFLAPARGRRALRGVMEGLATAEGRLVESDYPAALGYLAARNRKRALTVLFTDVVDRTASEALVARVGSLRPRHLPLAVVLRDPALEAVGTRHPQTVMEAYERAAAEELLLAREAALLDMRRRGVLVLDVPPGRAAEAVVDQYTQLKRRGVL